MWASFASAQAAYPGSEMAAVTERRHAANCDHQGGRD